MAIGPLLKEDRKQLIDDFDGSKLVFLHKFLIFIIFSIVLVLKDILRIILQFFHLYFEEQIIVLIHFDLSFIFCIILFVFHGHCRGFSLHFNIPVDLVLALKKSIKGLKEKGFHFILRVEGKDIHCLSTDISILMFEMLLFIFYGFQLIVLLIERGEFYV